MYKRYNSYQDSGVAWLGEIPSHWDESTINALTRVVSRKNRPDEPLLSVYRDYGVILKSSRDDNYNRPGQDLSTYKYVRPTNLVLNKMKTWQGSLGVSELHGIVSPAYITCELNIPNVFPKYLHYLLRCRNYIHEYNRLSYGVRTNQWDMRYDDFKKIPVFLPSNQEQHAIANFLDYKTAEIDCFIVNEEKLIAQLTEQRAAIINHAVTKGLDPDVQMKTSRVEWVGEIPKHWTITKLKYASNIPVTYGLNIEADRYTTEGIRLIRITDIDERGGLRQEGVYLPENCVPREQMLNDYDLLLSRSGATVGKSYLHLEAGQYTSAGYLVRFNFGDYCASKFIYYVTQSHFYRNWLEQQIIISTIQNVNGEKYSNFQLPIPSHQERKQIVNFLNHKTKQIDELVSKERQKIELIKKYRQALISQAVTGKIDVREAT